MDTRFRTSFVPKKTLAVKEAVPRSSSVHLFLASATIIFFFALATSAGLYLYKTLLSKKVEEESIALEKAKKAFETTFIVDAKRFDARIRAAKEILANHVSIHPVFDLLSATTLQTIRYTNLNYASTPSGVSISMDGQAKSFASVALQSDAFGANDKIFTPLFTDVREAQKGSSFTGVSFHFTGALDPSVISYSKMLSLEGSAVAPTVSSTTESNSSGQ